MKTHTSLCRFIHMKQSQVSVQRIKEGKLSNLFEVIFCELSVDVE